MWTVDYGYITDWLDQQDTETVARIFAALEKLQSDSPTVGRPLVDTLKGSQIKNLKERRPVQLRFASSLRLTQSDKQSCC